MFELRGKGRHIRSDKQGKAEPAGEGTGSPGNGNSQQLGELLLSALEAQNQHLSNITALLEFIAYQQKPAVMEFKDYPREVLSKHLKG